MADFSSTSASRLNGESVLDKEKTVTGFGSDGSRGDRSDSSQTGLEKEPSVRADNGQGRLAGEIEDASIGSESESVALIAGGLNGQALAEFVGPLKPEYEAADQFDSPEDKTSLHKTISVTKIPETWPLVAELADRTRIVESAAGPDENSCPITVGFFPARPIREADIQIIQSSSTPLKAEPVVPDATIIVGEKKVPAKKPGRKQKEIQPEARLIKAAPLGDPLIPPRRPIVSISAESTFLAHPLPVVEQWSHDNIEEEWSQGDDVFYEGELSGLDELSQEREFRADSEVESDTYQEEAAESDDEPQAVVLPVIPEPTPSLNMAKSLKAACFSPDLFKIPNLPSFLGHEVVLKPQGGEGIGAVITWGGKDHLPARQALMFAKKHDLPVWRIDDGFLRSLDIASRSPAPMSLVVDGTGIYYDANRPSDLENLLSSNGWETPELLAAAEKALRIIKTEGLSKFNHAPQVPADLLNGRQGRRRILILDQVKGDLSVSLGLAGPETFQAMLKAARYEHPGDNLFIKRHPEVIAGRKSGYFDLRQQTGLTVVDNYDPLSLIQEVDEVYTVSSLMGLEALFLGKTVHCFGLPFYAGWGLTVDRLALPRRNIERTLPELFAAAYILYPRYVNPITGRPAKIFEILRLLTDQRRHNNATRGFWALSGLPFWKRDEARAFFNSKTGPVRFGLNTKHAATLAKRHGGQLALWADSSEPGPLSLADPPSIIRVADGFLRSVGLRGSLTPPHSLILDPDGFYYDPARPSRLEKILAEFDFNENQELVARAAELIKAIVANNLSKYNRIGSRHLNFKVPQGRRIVLVPGQAESSQSLKLGSPKICTNADLLAEVRGKCPEAFIIYKPHPEVEKGERLGHVPKEIAARFADQVASEVDLAALWPHVEEVHTMTSLVGFEALIRGVETHTYGGPFYAGWQLTDDALEFPRRGRRLTVNELAAGALILYPTYYDWRTGLFCGPEEIVHALTQDELAPNIKVKLLRGLSSVWQRLFTKKTAD